MQDRFCEKAIDKFVDSLSYFQAINLRMVLLHAYSPYRSLENVYTQAIDEFTYSDKLKYDLKEAINCPTPFLINEDIKKEKEIEEENHAVLNKILNIGKNLDESETQSDQESKEFKVNFDKTQQENEQFANQLKKDMKKYMDGE